MKATNGRQEMARSKNDNQMTKQKQGNGTFCFHPETYFLPVFFGFILLQATYHFQIYILVKLALTSSIFIITTPNERELLSLP